MLPWPFVVLVKVIVAGPYVPRARLFAVAFTVKVMVVADVVAVPEVAEAVSQLGIPEIKKFAEPVVILSWYWNDEGEKGPPFGPPAVTLPAGVTSKVGTGTLTVSVAARVVLPRPFVVLAKVIVVGPYTPGTRVFALAFTVKVMVVADVVTVPEVAEAVSQLGRPEIEKPATPAVVLN